MNSFDLFDTLVTRLTADPADVFRLTEEVIGVSGFAGMRMSAETEARKRRGGREVTLQEIYDRVPLPLDTGKLACSVELRLEAQLSAPVTANLTRLVREGGLIVSDTYLSRETIAAILAKHVPDSSRIVLILSSDEGYRKASGALWDQIQRNGTPIRLHLGDNYNSDVLQPRRRRIPAAHFTLSRLNPFETRLASGSLDGSIVAGVARATRLKLAREGSSELELARTNLFASVIAPVLVGFVAWVIGECESRGIKKALFLARDGQLPYRIAKAMVDARHLDLEVEYIYGSRHALYVPGFRDIADAESWLLENTDVLSIATLASRGDLPITEIAEIAKDHGFLELTADVPSGERGRLRELIRDRRFILALEQASRKSWKAAFDYYTGKGVSDDSLVAIVDVGWTGRMQASLRRILEKGGVERARIVGLYLSVAEKHCSSELDEMKGFLFDPPAGRRDRSLDGYRDVIEAALAADHGTTVGFERIGSTVIPKFGPSPTESAREQILRQQDIVMTFTRHLLEVEDAIGRRVNVDRETVLEGFLHFLTTPNAEQVLAFSQATHIQGQADAQPARSLVTRLSWWSVLFDRRSLGFWPEGVFVASGLRGLLPLFQLMRTLKRRWAL